MSMTLWGNLPESVWVARCAVQMRQLEPTLDPDDSRELAKSLLDDASTGLAAGELALVSPEEAARRYASHGWVGYWPVTSIPDA